MTRWSKPWFRALASAAIPALLVVAACGGSNAPSGPTLNFTMTIGDVEPFTGDLGALGAPADKAVTLAVDQLNKASKSAGLGVTFKLVSADSQTDPQAALSGARKVIDGGATCITGPATTPETLAILNGVTKARKITVLPSATSARLRKTDDGGTIFRTAPPDNLQAIALITAVQAQLGGAQGKTVSIAYQNSPYGEGLANTFKDAWTKLGGSIQGPVGYDPNQPSYDSEAGKIVAGKPDAYVFADFPDTFGKVAAALLRTGKFDATICAGRQHVRRRHPLWAGGCRGRVQRSSPGQRADAQDLRARRQAVHVHEAVRCHEGSPFWHPDPLHGRLRRHRFRRQGRHEHRHVRPLDVEERHARAGPQDRHQAQLVSYEQAGRAPACASHLQWCAR